MKLVDSDGNQLRFSWKTDSAERHSTGADLPPFYAYHVLGTLSVNGTQFDGQWSGAGQGDSPEVANCNALTQAALISPFEMGVGTILFATAVGDKDNALSDAYGFAQGYVAGKAARDQEVGSLQARLDRTKGA
jgi:hypothetical protein